MKKIYPRTGDTQTVYLNAVVKDPYASRRENGNNFFRQYIPIETDFSNLLRRCNTKLTESQGEN